MISLLSAVGAWTIAHMINSKMEDTRVSGSEADCDLNSEVKVTRVMDKRAIDYVGDKTYHSEAKQVTEDSSRYLPEADSLMETWACWEGGGSISPIVGDSAAAAAVVVVRFGRKNTKDNL